MIADVHGARYTYRRDETRHGTIMAGHSSARLQQLSSKGSKYVTLFLTKVT